ncbi:MAG: hypothetical protein ACRELS_03980 [Candidatus Rokuibacteriota bacterium]
MALMRRRALWILIAAKILGGWGLGWDIRWHILIGRDSFWIAPHVMTYTAVAVLSLVSFAVLVADTRRARRGRAPTDTVRLAGLTGTRGWHLAWWGMALVILAAPLDDLWHRLFGIDVTLWSPPHLLGLVGSQVNTLAMLLIALEEWPAGRAARTAALLTAGTLLFGLFQILVDPSGRIAFLYGGVLFYTWAFFGALVFAFSFVLLARLTDRQSAPVVLVAASVLVQLSIWVVADTGFALLQPESKIEEAIKEDPTSPIAVAHEMARRAGVPPGRSLMLRLLPALPALVLALVDPRRRWLASSLAFGATLAATWGWFASRAPALAHAVPQAPEAAIGVGLSIVAAVIGGWFARELATLMSTPAVAGSPARLGSTIA